AERQLERLIFPVIAESGFGDERELHTSGPGATPDPAIPRIAAKDGQVEWWARIGPHYVPWAEYVKLRWIDPKGAVVRQGKPPRSERVFFDDAVKVADAAPGNWKLEVLLGDDIVHTQVFAVAP